jgi:CRP-like cAMP-binding protein
MQHRQSRAARLCDTARIAYVLHRADETPYRVQGVGSKENLLTRPQPALPATNQLLASLPREPRERLLAACETVELEADQVLLRAGRPGAHAYFPLDAIVSLRIAGTQGQQCFEVALVGREGMVGLPLLLGTSASPFGATVVRPGAALRIAAAPLRLQFLASQALRQRLYRYLLAALAQMAQAALCTRYHRVDQRLARWLLMAQDRAPDVDVHATHEFLAGTLGVRRAGVTRAAAGLQRRGLLVYRRGVLTLLDRGGLESAACACYSADRASYAALLRPPPPR